MNRELVKQFILEHVKSAEEAEEIVRYLPAVNWRAAWSETVAIRKEVMRDGDHYACFLPLSEHNRIQAHLSRAKDAGTEASLTDCGLPIGLSFFDTLSVNDHAGQFMALPRF